MDPLGGDVSLAKVIRDTGLSYIALAVKTVDKLTVVRVLSLDPSEIKTLFKFTFLDDPAVADESSTSEISADEEPDSLDAPIFTAQDLQTSTLDSLRRLYGAQTIEQSMRIFEDQKQLIVRENDAEYEAPTIFEKMEEEPPSVHRTRMILSQLSNMDTRTLVLHRKTFFDDQYEKLILMYV